MGSMPEPPGDVGRRVPSWSLASMEPAEALAEASRVRTWVRALLAGQREQRVLDVLLIADELVTSAVESGAAPRQVWVTLLDAGVRVRIEVDAIDRLTGGRHRPGVRGLGRLLLEQLTLDWGTDQHGEVTVTWAVLTLCP